jgi:energy-coupling factor transporter ATP-binding protein EcfA2
MSTQFEFDIFLSHSAKDKPVVQALAERLCAAGLKVWYDNWEITLGDSIPGKIDYGLTNSRVLLLFMSVNAFGSDWVRLERESTHFSDPLNRDRRLIPLLLDDAQIPPPLAQFQYLDWRTPNDAAFATLLKACLPRRPDYASVFGNNLLQQPIALLSVELFDIGGLHHIALPLAAPLANMGQWTVILGPNGVGKTTILRSLALALRNANDPSIWPKGTFANAWARVRASGDEPPVAPRICVKLADGSEHLTRIHENGSVTITQSPRQNLPALFPVFAYGCRRGSALGGAAREVDLSNTDGPEIATLFDEGADLIHAETWLIGMDGDAPKNPLSQIIFEVAIAALKTLLDVDNIEVAERRVWITEHGKPRLPFSALSDGYLTSAGWLLDLIARWVEYLRRFNLPIVANFMQTMRGLVLIDEIDLHLHPRWQIDIITRTRRLLPQMSFVVTTHNPLTLVGAKAEEIWILSNENGLVKATPGAEPPMLLTGGQIYRRYFGIDDIYPDGLGRAMQRFGVLAAYALRNDEEETELHELQQKLQAAGIAPEWDIVPRERPIAAPTKKQPAKRGKAPK